ncbi:LysR substrate-binding domain-containing protein, partial [Escherichia coli]|nr:LysR substrate-binding domain-containing protein [Escherichia coli]
MALARPVLDRLRHADVKLRLVTAIKEPALNALRAGEADLAITYHYSFRSQTLPDGLESEFLVADPLVLLAPPPAHAGVERDGLRALAEADWIA